MPRVSLRTNSHKFQEKSSDLETLLLELGFLCENVADPDSLLEPETFTTVTAYDALNRATSIRTPHNSSIPVSEILPAYNEASLLDAVNVKLRGAATATNFVSDIGYDCKLPQNLRQEACGMKGDMVFRKWAIATIIIFSQKGNRNN